MSGLTSRNKGKHGEQLAARILRLIWPDAKSRRAGGETLDVNPGRDMIGTPGACVQVKYAAIVDPWAAVAEAGQAAESGEIPFAMLKRVEAGSRAERPWIGALLIEDLVAIIAVNMFMDKLHNVYLSGAGNDDLGAAAREIFENTTSQQSELPS